MNHHDPNYAPNTFRLPSDEVITRLVDCGLTKYTLEEIKETAALADETLRKWHALVSKAHEVGHNNADFFELWGEKLERYNKIIEITHKYETGLSIFGSKRHSSEAYPLSTAHRSIKKLQTGIGKLETLVDEFEAKPIN